MRIHPVRIAVVLLLAGLLAGAVAQAQAPSTMVYQGRLLNSSGLPITASTSVTFRIYAAASEGSPLWTETRSVTPDVNGVFTIELGTTTSLTTATFDGTVRYMGIQVASESEMTPRQVLASTPYALRAAAAAAPASVEGVVNNGANIDIVPGAGLTVVGSDAANTITITPSSGGMHPVAWGFINSNGTIGRAGSGNWTVAWNATSSWYEITVSGLSYYYSDHVTLINGVSARLWDTGSVGGMLLVTPYLHDGTVSQNAFNFVIFNLPGMAKSGYGTVDNVNPEDDQ